MRIINRIVYRLVNMVTVSLERAHEKLKGVDFSLIDSSNEGEGRSKYQASMWYYRKAVGSWLSGKITRDDSIIDIGCGKGRMLYFFSKFPFRKIGGLEYSQELADVARKNMQVLRMTGGG